MASSMLLDDELNEKLSIGDRSGRPAAASSNNTNKNKFPLKNLHVAVLIDGKHTEFILTKYSNCLFVIVTQIEKLGTLFKITKANESTTQNISIDVLLGRRDEGSLEIFARQIGELICANTDQPLILALGLQNNKDEKPETLKMILRVLHANKIW